MIDALRPHRRVPTTSAIEDDWLVEELWPAAAARIAHAVPPSQRELARDVFGYLLLAAPRLRADAATVAPARARSLARLAVDPRVRAVRTLTVGDELACASWVPPIVAELAAAEGPDSVSPRPAENGDAAARAGGADLGVDPRRSGAGDLVDGGGARGGRGASSASAASAAPDEELLARLIGADDRATLRRLVAACRRGLSSHAGFVAAVRGARAAAPLTRDLARVAVDAWGALATTETEVGLWRRWSQGGLPSGILPPASPPPLIVLVDESGSMQLLLDGVYTRRTWALATLLACVEEAAASGREVVYLGFAGDGACWRQDIPGADPAAARAAVATVCRHFFGGGTAFEAPLAAALDLLGEPHARGARVLILSDGEGDEVPDALAARWRQTCARAGVRCWGVRIGGARATALEALTDAVAALEDFARAGVDGRYPALSRAAVRSRVID
ncbi:VWA domain containing CoxE-like protein [Microbacterium sp. AG790]|uniref:VWA domain-containing protein n=1 Tax=Microbacterium sp. AG790 TaxID=2183995 RepID=UPI000F2A9DA6|nr:VWA domain-containing protein [Microbacterium sp. AG790]RKS93077.1 VWA domain containing CoxE-like protein [Microbacterium sp. AG790]